MQTVYQSSLAIDAHMVCDLLKRADIPAQVLGDYLQSGAGELPLGLVRVTVDDDRADEARSVIADWEKAEPALPAVATSSAGRSRSMASSFLLVLLGGVLGAGACWWALNSPVTRSGIDYDHDGIFEEKFTYSGDRPSLVEFDRNHDRKIDAIQTYDPRGLAASMQLDDDFDGRFEGRMTFERGQTRMVMNDSDGDGIDELQCEYTYGVLTRCDYLDAKGSRVLKRQHFEAGILTSAEFDADGDGVFERTVRYDWMQEPVVER